MIYFLSNDLTATFVYCLRWQEKITFGQDDSVLY